VFKKVLKKNRFLLFKEISISGAVKSIFVVKKNTIQIFFEQTEDNNEIFFEQTEDN